MDFQGGNTNALYLWYSEPKCSSFELFGYVPVDCWRLENAPNQLQIRFPQWEGQSRLEFGLVLHRQEIQREFWFSQPQSPNCSLKALGHLWTTEAVQSETYRNDRFLRDAFIVQSFEEFLVVLMPVLHSRLLNQHRFLLFHKHFCGFNFLPLILRHRRCCEVLGPPSFL